MYVNKLNSPQLSILLVEDDVDTAGIFRSMLERLAVVVCVAGSMAEAKDCVETNAASTDVHFDAILLDLSLPDVRDLATVVAMCQATDLPVVVLTGSESDELVEAVIEAGAQDWLSKIEVSGPQIIRSLRLAIARDKISKARLIHLGLVSK